MTFKGRFSYQPADPSRDEDTGSRLPAARDLAIIRNFGAQGLKLILPVPRPAPEAAPGPYADA